MQLESSRFLMGYVKVDLRSRSPRLWGWGVYREGSDFVVQHSDALFAYPEDAWRAGRAALASLETLRSSGRVGQDIAA
jgi:hypothetical protein